MTRVRATLLQPTRPGKPYRFRLTLADGTKSPRFDCSPGLTEAKARAQAERMQAIEDETQQLYRDRLEKASVKLAARGETCDEWFARYLPTKKCGESFRRITGQVWGKWVSRSLGREPIATLTKRHVEDFRDTLDIAIKAGRLSTKSAANVWSTFTSAMKAASNSKTRALKVRDGKADVLFGVLPPDRGTSAQRPWLYPTEWERLVRCEDVPVASRALYAVAAYTGARPNELRALVWGDVDLTAGIISIARAWDEETGTTKPPKTAAGIRTIPILPELRPLLEAMRGAPSEPVVAAFDGRRHAETFRAHLRAANVLRPRLHEKTATEEPVDFRSLRDTHATWACLQGVPITTLQRRLGHRDLATTGVYVKAAEVFETATVGEPFPTIPPSLVRTVFQTNTAKTSKKMVARVGFEPSVYDETARKRLNSPDGVGPKTPEFWILGGDSDRISDQATERTMLGLWLEEEDVLGGLPMSPGGDA